VEMKLSVLFTVSSCLIPAGTAWFIGSLELV